MNVSNSGANTGKTCRKSINNIALYDFLLKNERIKGYNTRIPVDLVPDEDRDMNHNMSQT